MIQNLIQDLTRVIIRFPVPLLVLVTTIFANQSAQAQDHLFSEVNVRQTAVYVGQPAQVTISVYTSTWFTEGVDPGNITVEGAFTVYFRSVSNSRQIDGKTWAGVDLLYHVFPFDDEDISIPALEIRVVTPDEGDYKGVPRVVKTRSKTITVKSVPQGFDQDEWLVASGMSVNDSWGSYRSEVEVGDVIERSITRNVPGTVAELIPPVTWDSIGGISFYPSRSNVDNQRSRTAISATRTDRVSYLFEEEGEITIPSMELTWYNPAYGRLYKRTLGSRTFTVKPNPELGALDSLRQALSATLEPEQVTVVEASEKRFKLKAWHVLVFLALFPLITYLIRLIRYVSALIRRRRANYLQSELYYFRQFKKAATRNYLVDAVNALYEWILQLKLEEPTMKSFAIQYGNDDLLDEVDQINRELLVSSGSNRRINMKHWIKARNTYLEKQSTNKVFKTESWINP